MGIQGNNPHIFYSTFRVENLKKKKNLNPTDQKFCMNKKMTLKSQDKTKPPLP